MRINNKPNKKSQLRSNCCSSLLSRRRLLYISTVGSLVTFPAGSAGQSTKCSVIILNNDQVDLISEENSVEEGLDEMLGRMRSNSAEPNFVYLDDASYDPGQGIVHETTYSTVSKLVTAVSSATSVDLESTELDVDCSRLPFERDFDVEITSSPSEPERGESVVLEAQPTNIQSDNVVRYEWEIETDGEIDQSGQQTTMSLTQEQATISVTATTDVRTTGEASTILTTTPTASITPSFTYSPNPALATDQVAFDATGTMVKGTKIAAYEWDFNSDGTVDATGSKTVHSFDPGTHDVSLTVRGINGTEETTTQILDVASERLNISITASDTQFAVGEQTSIQYSVNSYLNTEELTVQLLVETPSNVDITGVSGAEEGSNQFVAVSTLGPASQEQVRINLVANSPGTYTVTAIADYYFGENRQSGDRISEKLSFTVEQEGSEDSEMDVNTSDSTPGFGVESGLAALAGAGYMLRNRLADNPE